MCREAGAMTHRTRFGWRIGVILVTGLMALGSVPIALYFMIQGAERVAGLPNPEQVEAIVRLVEQVPELDRRAVIDAFHSPQMSLRIVPGADIEADQAPFWPEPSEEMARYHTQMPGRELAVYAAPRKLFPNSFYDLLRAAEFRIALRGGGVLIITSESVAWFTDFGLPIGFTSAVAGVLVSLIALILLNREFRPVLRLAKAVEALDPSDPEARLPPIRASTEEVRALIRSFDRQQGRVAALLHARACLVGGIQHDVRTFATRLRLRVEKLADVQDRAEAEAEISDLVALMDGALLATRSEVGKLDLELVDLSELLEAEIRDQQATGARVDLDVRAAARGAQILGDRVALRRIVSNLLENALRHGTRVRVVLTEEEQALALTVDDDGPGIPPDQREVLLEPFVRLDLSRSRQTGGAGLGLSIVKALVDIHQGSLCIRKAEIGGARVIVRLPLFQPSCS
jgi:signal transduction histidine kinase